MSMFTRSDKAADKPTADHGKEAQTIAPATAPEQRPKASPHANSGPSLISAALTVTGNLESAGEIQIDGKVEGDVRAHTVKVGEGASIKGAVFGESVELSGAIDGRIEAKLVSLKKTSRMTGDIVHESLQIESGAYIDGHCRPHYGKAKSAAAAAPQQFPQERKVSDKPTVVAEKVESRGV